LCSNESMSPSTALRTAAATLNTIATQLGDSMRAASESEKLEFRAALRALIGTTTRCMPESAPITLLPMGHDVERSLRITQESVDNAPIGIYRIDGDARVVGANRAACESLGYTREELESLTVFDFDGTFTRETWLVHRAETRALGASTVTTTHRRKDGTTFPVEVYVKQFMFDGEPYTVTFVKDLTETLRAEQDRRRLEVRMMQAQKLESLGVLAGGIAHDFNNLLMIMLGNLEVALQRIPPAAVERAWLSDADAAAHQAADLCRQLLIYAGKGKSLAEPVDLGALLRDQAKMLEVIASKSIRLLLNQAADLPKIRADVSQLRQVFMNLIINASDAIGQTAGVISISTSTITCDKEYLDASGISHMLEPGYYVSVEVADTGCGMNEAVRERIFDPFFSTKTASRGLGLAAVRGIVSKHGGAIRVYSEPGAGTTFRLLFPVPKSLDTRAPAPEPAEAWRGSGVVLVVDDEEALRSLAQLMLDRLGFEALVARNGIEGLALFKEHRDRIGYVLLDWTMPEMGGGETFVELRRLKPDLRIILASGHAPDDILMRLGSRHVTAFVRKPYNMKELAAAFQAAHSEKES